MLKGDKVGLRARHEDDIPVLRAELYDDVVNASRAESGPWRPITPGSKDPRLVVDDKEQKHVPLSVVERDGGTLIGAATLWGIDNHNRSAVRAHRAGAVAVLARQGPRHRRGRGARSRLPCGRPASRFGAPVPGGGAAPAGPRRSDVRVRASPAITVMRRSCVKVRHLPRGPGGEGRPRASPRSAQDGRRSARHVGRLPVPAHSTGDCRLRSLTAFSMMRAHVVNTST
ncbi:hypothetical protein SUDANB126_03854 [Streptomyces sp. enrichment culture]